MRKFGFPRLLNGILCVGMAVSALGTSSLTARLAQGQGTVTPPPRPPSATTPPSKPTTTTPATPTAPSRPPSAAPTTPPSTSPTRPPATPPTAAPAKPPTAAPATPPPVTPPRNPAAPPNPNTRPANPPGTPAPLANPAAPRPNTAPPKNQPKASGDEELKPQDLVLTTSDGVRLKCVYFPSDRGKKAVPVILIHEFEGQSAPYYTAAGNRPSLAMQLQNAGFAVICPDLRGHGGSLAVVGSDRPLDRARFSKRDIIGMIDGDMEAVKSYLRAENDAGKLNLNALTLIGIQDGCVIAMNWTANDWNWPTIPGKKQGQDVKALVLVSPQKLIKGVTYEPLLKHAVVSRLPTLIVAGAQSEQAEEAERMKKLLAKTRDGKSMAGLLQVELPPTSVSGLRLVTLDPVPQMIIEFLGANVAEHQDQFGWVKREK